MAKTITGIVTWLKNWFYDKTDIDGFINTINGNISNKVDKNQQQANKNVITDGTGAISLEPQINVASGSGLSLNNSTKALSHTNVVSTVLNDMALKIQIDGTGHITHYSEVTGSDIAVSSTEATTPLATKISSIETAISNLQNFKFLEIVTSKPNPSAPTMNKLYIVSETVNNKNQINVYYTKATTNNDTTTYSWVKLDENILDEIDFTDFAPLSHVDTKAGTGTFGHVKIADNLTTSTHTSSSPIALTAHQGYLLNQSIQAVDDKVDGLTLSDFNPTASDIAYTASSQIWGEASQGITNVGSALTFLQENIADYDNIITSIELLPKSSNATGAIKLYLGNESTSGHGTDWTDLK